MRTLQRKQAFAYHEAFSFSSLRSRQVQAQPINNIPTTRTTEDLEQASVVQTLNLCFRLWLTPLSENGKEILRSQPHAGPGAWIAEIGNVGNVIGRRLAIDGWQSLNRGFSQVDFCSGCEVLGWGCLLSLTSSLEKATSLESTNTETGERRLRLKCSSNRKSAIEYLQEKGNHKSTSVHSPCKLSQTTPLLKTFHFLRRVIRDVLAVILVSSFQSAF